MVRKNVNFGFICIIIIFVVCVGGSYANLNAIALSHLKFLEPTMLEPTMSGVEPFKSSYNDCVSQFYPKEWCLHAM